MPMRFLHLHTSKPDADSITTYLDREWPHCSVQQVNQADHFARALRANNFDLILAEDAPPGIDALRALALARERCPEKPIILLADSADAQRAAEAMQQGATDYVTMEHVDRLVPAIHDAMTRLRENRLVESRIRELAVLLDKVQDAVIVQSADGMITSWNQGAEGIYGWKAGEAVGRDAAELLPVDRTRQQVAMESALQHGEWNGELRHRTKQGSEVTVKSRWTMVDNLDGVSPALVVVNTDMTGTKMLEAKFLRAQRMESVGMLVGGIAHDLSNVLAPILMSSELLRSQASTPQAHALIDAMHRSARHGEALVRQLLAFARGAEGQLVEVNLEPLLTDFADFMRRMLNGAAQLELEMGETLPLVRADATQLKQVLMNLCINARDAMPEGGRIKITAERTTIDVAQARSIPEGFPGGYAQISVTDTGVGMPEDVLERIFDPFFTTKDVTHGTGLGLSTVRSIVKSHGGFVAVDSEPGSGTMFRIYLPMHSPTATKPAPIDMPAILLADDEEMVRNTISLLLKADGYHVYLAEDGTEAFNLFTQRLGEIDLVITDLKMAGMDGYELIKAIKEKKPDMPVIALTGMANATHEAAVRAAGARLLAKPMTRSTLSKAVGSALAAAV